MLQEWLVLDVDNGRQKVLGEGDSEIFTSDIRFQVQTTAPSFPLYRSKLYLAVM